MLSGELTVGKHVLKVPASKKQALINGNYDGKTVVLGIRPEDVHDSQAFISNSPDSIIESVHMELSGGFGNV